MRKLLLLTTALFMTLTSFAQFEQGRMMVGGEISLQSYKQKTKSGSTTTTFGTSTDYSFTPRFGYFVIDNLAVGAGIANNFSHFNPDDDNLDYLESTSSSSQFQPFVRYYLPQRIFFEGDFGFGFGSTKDYEGNKSSHDISSWSLAAGYAILLNENVAIEPILGYGSTRSKYKDNDPEYTSINTGLFIQVGFQVYLGK